jgi:prevent-host-death family protein
MEQIGVRELKSHLAHYLRAVRKGQSIVVTKRGKPIARLVPFPQPGHTAMPTGLESKLWKLNAQGLLTWNGSAFQLPESAAVNRSESLLSDLVVEDRE